MDIKQVQVAGDWKTPTALNRFWKRLPNAEQEKAQHQNRRRDGCWRELSPDGLRAWRKL
jgi:hypothetical protein